MASLDQGVSSSAQILFQHKHRTCQGQMCRVYRFKRFFPFEFLFQAIYLYVCIVIWICIYIYNILSLYHYVYMYIILINRSQRSYVSFFVKTCSSTSSSPKVGSEPKDLLSTLHRGEYPMVDIGLYNQHIWVEKPKNRGILPPKWINVTMVPNPMNKWMIWQVFPYFWVDTHIHPWKTNGWHLETPSFFRVHVSSFSGVLVVVSTSTHWKTFPSLKLPLWPLKIGACETIQKWFAKRPIFRCWAFCFREV